MGPVERVLIASRAVWFYAGKLLWPANLTFSYPRWTISASDPSAYGWLLAAAAAGCGDLAGAALDGAGRGSGGAVFCGDIESGAGIHHAIHISAIRLWRIITNIWPASDPIALAAAGIKIGLDPDRSRETVS